MLVGCASASDQFLAALFGVGPQAVLHQLQPFVCSGMERAQQKKKTQNPSYHNAPQNDFHRSYHHHCQVSPSTQTHAAVWPDSTCPSRSPAAVDIIVSAVARTVSPRRSHNGPLPRCPAASSKCAPFATGGVRRIGHRWLHHDSTLRLSFVGRPGAAPIARECRTSCSACAHPTLSRSPARCG